MGLVVGAWIFKGQPKNLQVRFSEVVQVFYLQPETACNPENHAESKQGTNDTASGHITFTLTSVKR